MPLWAKVDVDMPTDEKLFGQPLATRHLWTCLICLAKRQDDDGAVRGYTCDLLAGAFNIPRKLVAAALTHYQMVRMVELDPGDGTIHLVNFSKRQGEAGAAPGSYDKRCRSMLVYFIQDSTSGLIKIGTSKNPWARLKTLQQHHGSPLKLLGTIRSAGWDVETDLHRRFAAARRTGEWFDPVADLVAMANGSLAVAESVPRLQLEVEEEVEEEKDQKTLSPSAPPPSTQPITELESDWPKDLLSKVKEAITSTRKSGHLSEGPWRSFLLRARLFAVPIRVRSASEYLDRAYAAEGKDERYLLGIMRGERKQAAHPNGQRGAQLHVDNEKLRLEPSGRKML